MVERCLHPIGDASATTLSRQLLHGRLFVGERNDGELPAMTIGRVWRAHSRGHLHHRGRRLAAGRRPTTFGTRPVSTWLNGGVPPTTVAEWAGHSVEVLLRIYAKCLDGGDALVRRRVTAALGYADTGNDNGEVTASNPATPPHSPDHVVSQS